MNKGRSNTPLTHSRATGGGALVCSRQEQVQEPTAQQPRETAPAARAQHNNTRAQARPPPRARGPTCSSLNSHSRVSVATWSLRLRPVWSFPPAGPISSVSRRSLAVWMSSSPGLMTNVPPPHSLATWGARHGGEWRREGGGIGDRGPAAGGGAAEPRSWASRGAPRAATRLRGGPRAPRRGALAEGAAARARQMVPLRGGPGAPR